jgi:uncharacterized protein (TIGR03067 family)
MRRTVCLLATLLVLPSLGSDSPKEYDDNAEIDGLQGTWQLVEAQGKTIPPEWQIVEIFRSGKWTLRSGGEIKGEGIYEVDVTRHPATFDERATGIWGTWDDGMTKRGIYRIERNMLWTANKLEGEVRPKSFSEDGLYIAVWKRVKK